MRPILFELPSALLCFALIVSAIFLLLRERARGRYSSTPPFLLVCGIVLAVVGAGNGWRPVPVYGYATALFSSFVVGWFMTRRWGYTGLAVWTAVASIIGGRLLFVATNPSAFQSPFEVLQLWKGGLVAYGGMFGGFVASVYLCRRHRVSLLEWADAAAPAVVVGTAITRVGCLLYGCDFGLRTDARWGVSFPVGSPAWSHHRMTQGLASDAGASFPVHPTQLYEALAALIILGLLVGMRRLQRASGEVFLLWVVAYGMLRPFIELFRDDPQRGSVGPLSTSQLIGIASAVVAFSAWVWLRHSSSRGSGPGESAPLPLRVPGSTLERCSGTPERDPPCKNSKQEARSRGRPSSSFRRLPSAAPSRQGPLPLSPEEKTTPTSAAASVRRRR